MAPAGLPDLPGLPVLPGHSGPSGPFVSAVDLNSTLPNEPLTIFDALTEFGFSCRAPTLFRGITMLTAATLVPASATRSAIASDHHRRGRTYSA